MMLRFSEWFNIESFVDAVNREKAREIAFVETAKDILKTARLAFSVSSGLLESCSPELEAMSQDEKLSVIYDSLMVIRRHAMNRRKRLVDAAGDIQDWMTRSEKELQDFLKADPANKPEDWPGLDDLDLSNFSDVLEPQKIAGKDTLQAAVLILSKLEYCTAKEAKDMLSGMELPGPDTLKDAWRAIKGHVVKAAQETGNDVVISDKDDLSKARADFVCAAKSVYGRKIRKLTRENERRTGGVVGDMAFEDDDLFNDFFLKVEDMASRRKWSTKSLGDGASARKTLSPWGEGSSFEDILSKRKSTRRRVNKGRKSDDEKKPESEHDHLRKYFYWMLKTTASGTRKKRGSTNNPVSGDKVAEIHNDKHRKAGILSDDLALYIAWKDEARPPNANQTPNPLQFYLDYLDEDKRDNLQKTANGEDAKRLKIMQGIEYEFMTSPSTRSFLSLNPEDIEKTLTGYLNNFLRESERRSTFSSELVSPEGGSSEEALSSMARNVLDMDRSNDDPDSELSAKSMSGATEIAQGSVVLTRFFRPYVIRGIKAIAARGGDSIVKAIFLCFRFQVPCSFQSDTAGGIHGLVVGESENLDADLDSRIKSYLFEKLGGPGRSPFEAGKDGEWSWWGDEDHMDDQGNPNPRQKTLRKDSFCSMFFRTLHASELTTVSMSSMLSELPETEREIPDGRGGSSKTRHYEYDPAKFTTDWRPTGRMNSLAKEDRKTGLKVHKYGKASVGEILNGNPQMKRGALADLCDLIFGEFMREENASLKDLMITKKRVEAERKSAIERRRMANDERYRRSMSRPLPAQRPSMTGGASPLGRFVRKENPPEDTGTEDAEIKNP